MLFSVRSLPIASSGEVRAMPQLHCKLCPRDAFDTDDLDAIVQHTRHVHSQLPAAGGRFVCCLPDCSVAKPQLQAWQRHVKRCSERSERIQPDPVAYTTVFPCSSVEPCNERFSIPGSLMTHLREHLSEDQAVVCPYQNCLERIDSVRTFHRHSRAFHENELPAGRMVVNVSCDDDDADTVLDDANPDTPGRSENSSQPDFATNDVDELPPAWFAAKSVSATTLGMDCGALCLSANVLFNVPKSKVRPLFQLVDHLTSRWLPDTCNFTDLLRQHCDPLIVDELASQIMDRVTTQLPLRHTYDRSVGASSLVTDYRLRKELETSMRYVQPVDLHEAILVDPNFGAADCEIPKTGG